MELVYMGGCDAVEVPLPAGGAVVVGHGESHDFADPAHAALLLEQPDNWQPANPAAKKKREA